MSFKFQCIKCGKRWGESLDADGQISHGICIECFAVWFNDKRRELGLEARFGQFDEKNDVCKACLVKRFCKEYNGIK